MKICAYHEIGLVLNLNGVNLIGTSHSCIQELGEIRIVEFPQVIRDIGRHLHEQVCLRRREHNLSLVVDHEDEPVYRGINVDIIFQCIKIDIHSDNTDQFSVGITHSL